ncbi:unnamed protein product, partial [Rotaria magnacalcarata]
MTRKYQLAHDQLQQSKIVHQEIKSAFSKCSLNIRATSNQIQNIRKENSYVKDLYAKEIQNWKIYLATVDTTLQKEIQTTIDKYTKRINNYRIEIEGYQQQINETSESSRDLQTKYQQLQ